MQTILVPTDFSSVSDNAVDYAAAVANCIKAKLILFHVYPIPVTPTETLAMIPVERVEKGCFEALNSIKKRIQASYDSSFEIECGLLGGFVVSEINYYADQKKVDLIVVGMQGAGYLAEKIFGNVTATLIKKAECPVLAIHKDVKFKNIEQIALACDYEGKYSEATLKPLKELAHAFKAHICLLNVSQSREVVPTTGQAVSGIKLDHALEQIPHTFYASVNEDLIEGINNFVKEKKIDMLVMIPRSHNFIHQIFYGSNAKRMAFHTTVPLLALN